MLLNKPVIAAVEGYAVAGGLELALWSDLRVAARDATFGVYCRRFGVPLCDGGTIRLPRLLGMSRAMDMILTGRGVSGEEAFAMGLANRVVDPGTALTRARARKTDRELPTTMHARRPDVRIPSVDDAARRCAQEMNIDTESRRSNRARRARARRGSRRESGGTGSFRN